MKATRLPTLLFALFLSTGTAAGQGLPPLPPGGYYISCPYALNNVFFMYSYLPYQGHEWSTSWRATSSAMPLPPRQWYAPVGTSDIISTDGQAKWIGAQVEVLCWIYNGLDFIVYHYDPYRFSGTVVDCSGGGGGGGTPWTSMDEISDSSYDPYLVESPTSCGDGGTGHGGEGSSCHQEWVVIEISYDGGNTWGEWWAGWASVCT